MANAEPVPATSGNDGTKDRLYPFPPQPSVDPTLFLTDKELALVKVVHYKVLEVRRNFTKGVSKELLGIGEDLTTESPCIAPEVIDSPVGWDTD